MKRQILALAAVVAGGLLISDTGGEAQGRTKDYSVCQAQYQPMCMAGWMPRCTSTGWRCIGPGDTAPEHRQRESCLSNMNITCIAPATPRCRQGRWSCL